MRSLTVAGIAIPDGVREAIDRRLRRLSPDCRRVLSAAAVLGPRWTFDLLVVVVGLDEERTLDAVEEALAAGSSSSSRTSSAPATPSPTPWSATRCTPT